MDDAQGSQDDQLRAQAGEDDDPVTERDQPRADAQCLRCGRQFDEDSDNEDDCAGWIYAWPGVSDDYLCPNCMTSAEALADTERFIETLREGQQRAQEQASLAKTKEKTLTIIHAQLNEAWKQGRTLTADEAVALALDSLH